MSVLAGDDTRLVPVRVAWVAEERGGPRAARLNDVLTGHDPYHPSERQQRRILARQPGRAAVLVLGEPATVGSLRRRWAETTSGNDFPGYVARRATLALDQAEYRLRGPRYKTPSLVKDEILSSRRFRAGLRTVRHGAAPSLEEAGEILEELAAGWSLCLIDIMPTAGTFPARLRSADRLRPGPGGAAAHGDGAAPGHLAVVAPVQPRHAGARRGPAGAGDPRLAHLFACLNMAFGPMGAIMVRR